MGFHKVEAETERMTGEVMLRGEDGVKNDPGPQEVRFSLNQENKYLSIPMRWDIRRRMWE